MVSHDDDFFKLLDAFLAGELFDNIFDAPVTTHHVNRYSSTHQKLSQPSQRHSTHRPETDPETIRKSAQKLRRYPESHSYRPNDVMWPTLEDIRFQMEQDQYAHDHRSAIPVENLAPDPVNDISDEMLGTIIKLFRSALSWSDRERYGPSLTGHDPIDDVIGERVSVHTIIGQLEQIQRDRKRTGS